MGRWGDLPFLHPAGRAEPGPAPFRDHRPPGAPPFTGVSKLPATWGARSPKAALGGVSSPSAGVGERGVKRKALLGARATGCAQAFHLCGLLGAGVRGMRTWHRSWELGVGSGFRNPGRGAEGALRMSSVVPVGALRSVVGGRGGTQSRCLGRGAAGLAQAPSPRQLQREETRKPRRRRRPDAPNTLTGLIAPKLSSPCGRTATPPSTPTPYTRLCPGEN